MSLPSAWVDRLFARMFVRYGAAWTRMWENVDPEMLKADWAQELDRLPADALAYGVENLPADKPPTVAQFKTLCINRPPEAFKALPPPKVDKELAAKVLKGIRVGQTANPMSWAERLRDREKAGENLTPGQRSAWRAAMESKPVLGVGNIGDFTPVPADMLPPAMRGEA